MKRYYARWFIFRVVNFTNISEGIEIDSIRVYKKEKYNGKLKDGKSVWFVKRQMMKSYFKNWN